MPREGKKIHLKKMEKLNHERHHEKLENRQREKRSKMIPEDAIRLPHFEKQQTKGSARGAGRSHHGVRTRTISLIAIISKYFPEIFTIKPEEIFQQYPHNPF